MLHRMSITESHEHAIDSHERVIQDAVARLSADALATQFAKERLLVLDPLPRSLVNEMVDEARPLAKGARRTYVPFVRKGGAVGHARIRQRAPALHALQRSPSLLSLFQRIAGPELEHRRPDDPHASAIYVYARRGDHVGWHYDDCGCEPQASFTVIMGLVDNSSSRLDIELFRSGKTRRPERRAIATGAGSMVFFCGSEAYHRVTALRSGEERISFSFVYVKNGHHPRGVAAWRQTAINTFLYFGVAQSWSTRGSQRRAIG